MEDIKRECMSITHLSCVTINAKTSNGPFVRLGVVERQGPTLHSNQSAASDCKRTYIVASGLDVALPAPPRFCSMFRHVRWLCVICSQSVAVGVLCQPVVVACLCV